MMGNWGTDGGNNFTKEKCWLVESNMEVLTYLVDQEEDKLVDLGGDLFSVI